MQKYLQAHWNYLMFEICYLILEVSDVLAGVCVVELTLDLSFLFLNGKKERKGMREFLCNHLELLAIIYKIISSVNKK